VAQGTAAETGPGAWAEWFDEEGRLRWRRNEFMPATRGLAQVIRTARAAAKMSLRELARRTWLPKSTCAQAETEGETLAVEALVRIGMVLGLLPSRLFAGAEHPGAGNCPI